MSTSSDLLRIYLTASSYYLSQESQILWSSDSRAWPFL